MSTKMKCFGVLGGLTLAVGVIFIGAGHTQVGLPPDLEVIVALDKSSYLLDDSLTPDPIRIGISLKNVGADFITTLGFNQKPFHLLLIFTGPDGKLHTTKVPADAEVALILSASF